MVYSRHGDCMVSSSVFYVSCMFLAVRVLKMISMIVLSILHGRSSSKNNPTTQLKLTKKECEVEEAKSDGDNQHSTISLLSSVEWYKSLLRKRVPPFRFFLAELGLVVRSVERHQISALPANPRWSNGTLSKKIYRFISTISLDCSAYFYFVIKGILLHHSTDSASPRLKV